MALAGKGHQVMLQGVHELYELNETPQLWGEDPRVNRLIFIGEDTRDCGSTGSNNTKPGVVDVCLLSHNNSALRDVCTLIYTYLCPVLADFRFVSSLLAAGKDLDKDILEEHFKSSVLQGTE